jgi:predicted MFS family arabinose efflux permease
MTSGSTSEIRDGWRCLLSALVGTALGAPTLPFYTIGIFAPILAGEFGWSLAVIFGGLLLNTVVLLMGGPIVGHLVDRLGARIVAAVSLAGLGVGYAAFALSSASIVQYYATWAFLAVVSLGSTSISFTRAINSTFSVRRGLALGIALSGIGLCALIMKPLAGWLLEWVGWRMTILTIGLMPILVGTPIVLWGMPRRTASSASIMQDHLAPSLTLREAVRTRTFAILVCSFVIIAFANGAPIPHLENILRSTGLAAQQVLALTSVIGVAVIAGRLVGGWILDHVWAPIAGVAVASAAAVGCWLLSQQSLEPREAITAIVLLGFCGGVEGDLLSYLIVRYFGVRSYGAVYGTIFGLFALGAGAGPSLIGYAYDRLGTYSQILTACALLLLLAAALLLSLGRYPAGARAA